MIVLDNSVLSAFTRLNNLHLIREIFRNVAIPIGVYEEYIKGWDPKALPSWIIIENLGEEDRKTAESLNLGIGEAHAIVLASHQDCFLGLDDENARETAKKKGIDIIGSIGILRIAYESCLIETKDQLKNLLGKLAEDLYLENWLLEWALKAEKLTDEKRTKRPGLLT